MNANAKTAGEWLELLVEHAPALRAAGVLTVRAGDGFEATIAPEVPEMPEQTGRSDIDYGGDALDDPDTFGGRLPTFRRQ